MIPGSVFLAGDPDRKAAVLTTGASALQAELADGRTISVDYRGAEVSHGGADDRMLFVRGPDGTTICCEDPRLVPLLRSAALGLLDQALDAAAGSVKSSNRRWAAVWLAVAASILALLISAAVFIPWAARKSVDALPHSVDKQLGDSAWEQMDLGGKTVTDPLVVGAIQQMVDRLKPAAGGDWDFRIQVVASGQVNAFALPGGRICVYTGLIAKAQRPEQVAGVIAHELAHVTRRHGIHAAVNQVGMLIGLQLLVGDTSGLIGLAGQGAMLAYSRDNEREADAEGARMLAAAGLDPLGLAEFFDLLKGEKGSELPGFAQVLSTHPDHDDRIAAITVLIPTLPTARTPLTVDWPAVQAAARATIGQSVPPGK